MNNLQHLFEQSNCNDIVCYANISSNYVYSINEGLGENGIVRSIGAGLLFGGLIVFILWAASNRQDAIIATIDNAFTRSELIEIKGIITSDPLCRKYRNDLDTYTKMKLAAKNIDLNKESHTVIKDAVVDIYHDMKVKELKYKIESRAKEILPKDYYIRLIELDDELMRRFRVTSGILY